MRFLTPEAPERLARIGAGSGPTLLCLDFDGVLAPIVDDPAQAVIHPRAHDVLASMAGSVATIAIVTGRPAAQAVRLGSLETLATRLAGSGTTLVVHGQYGAERWSSQTGRVDSSPPPPGLADFEAAIPRLLDAADASEAFVEDKGLAVALHTRRMSDPEAALARLVPVVEAAAATAGLKVEPGRLVVEVRGAGQDKGDVVRQLTGDLAPTAVVYVGDDLGDTPAFRAVVSLREQGVDGLLVCSASAEETSLLELADLAVDGPTGVMELLAATWGTSG